MKCLILSSMFFQTVHCTVILLTSSVLMLLSLTLREFHLSKCRVVTLACGGEKLLCFKEIYLLFHLHATTLKGINYKCDVTFFYALFPFFSLLHVIWCFYIDFFLFAICILVYLKIVTLCPFIIILTM